jgi:hypothetical protein
MPHEAFWLFTIIAFLIFLAPAILAIYLYRRLSISEGREGR